MSIKTDGKYFVKMYATDELFHEALKNSVDAENISDNCKIFRAPGVLDHRPDTREIFFEYLDGFQQVLVILRDFNYQRIPSGELKSLFFDIGYGLAEYHQITGTIHGDFDPTNVMFLAESNKLAYIDFSRPINADYAGYNIGSIYRDLALFSIYIKVKYPYNKLHCALRSFNRELTKSLFQGYSSLDVEFRFDGNEFETVYNEYLSNPWFSRNFLTAYFRWSRLFSYDELLKI